MKVKNRNLIIMAVLFTAYTSIYIARLNISAASVSLNDLGILTTQKYGIIAGVFSATFAFGRLFNGALSDRIHPAVSIAVGLFLTGGANIAFSFFPPYVLLLVLWGINAYAQSMLWSSVLVVVSACYDTERAKTVSSYMVSSVAVGNIIGMVLNAAIVERLGAKFAFVIPGAITLICCLAVIITVPKVSVVNISKDDRKSFISILSDKNVRNAILPVVFHGVVKDNIGMYVFQFLTAVYFVNLENSSYLAMFIPIMGFVGRLLYPFVYKMLGNREHYVSTYCFIGATLFSLLLLLKTSVIVSALCMGLIYTATSMINTSMLSVFPLEYAKYGTTAAVSGMMDFFAYLGCAVGSVVFGFIIPKFGFNTMFVIWGVVLLLSVVLLHPLRKYNNACLDK